MEFQWNQIFAIKNWHYIELYIEKSIKIKFLLSQAVSWTFSLLLASFYAILDDIISLKCTMFKEYTLDKHLE